MSATLSLAQFENSIDRILDGSFVMTTDLEKNAAQETLPTEVKVELRKVELDLTSSAENQKEQVTKPAQTYLNDKDQAEFDRAIDEQAKHNIDTYTRQQKDLAVKLKAEGKKYPKSRHAIIAAYKAVSRVFNKIMQKLTEFFMQLMRKIAKWLTETAKKIATFFSSVFQVIGTITKVISISTANAVEAALASPVEAALTSPENLSV